MSNTDVSGSDLWEFEGTTPRLREIDCTLLSGFGDQELLHILRICGPSLKSLNISKAEVTGEILSEHKGPQPVLQHLNISKTERKITDKGLIQILNTFGKTLVSLDVSVSRVTGRNLRKFKGSLPCLANLQCNATSLTQEGVFHILELSGGTLQRLALIKTKLKSNILERIHEDFPNLLLMPKYSEHLDIDYEYY